MRLVGKVLLAGAAAAALAAATAAYAGSRPAVHHLALTVPGYGVERIDYTGNVAPRVVMVPSLSLSAAAWPAGVAWQQSPFAMMHSIAAQMDAMSRAMDRQMAASFAGMQSLQNFALQAQSNPAILASMPSGGEDYSVISTVSANGICARSVTITSNGAGAKPQVVSRTSGDCGAAGIAAAPMTTRAASHTILPPEGRHSI